MLDLDVQIRAYVDATSKPLTVADVLGTPPLNGVSLAVTPATGMLEDRLGPDPTPSERAEPDDQGDDLTVDYLQLRPDESESTSKLAGLRGSVLAVAAAVLVVAGVVVVADRNGRDIATDPISSSGTDPLPSPTVTAAPVAAEDVVTEPEVTNIRSCGEASAGQVIERPSGWLRVCGGAAFDGAVMYSVVAGGPGLVAVGATLDVVETLEVDTTPAVEAALPGVDCLWEWDIHFPADPCPGDLPPVSDAAVWTSVDGLHWWRVPHDEAVFGGDGSRQIFGVVVGGPGLVAVGRDGRDGRDQGDAAVWTSDDGLTWSRVPHDEAAFGGEGRQRMLSVTAGGPGLVAVGTDGHPGSKYVGSNRIDVLAADAAVWTSGDGLTWSRVPHDEEVFGGPGEQRMDSVTAGGPGLVAVGYASRELRPEESTYIDYEPGLEIEEATVWTSGDGSTWSRATVGDFADVTPDGGDYAAFMLNVTAAGPGLVAVGVDNTGQCGSDEAVWTSSDGVVWTQLPDERGCFTGDGADDQMISVTVGAAGLVAVGWTHDGVGAAAAWVEP